MSTSYLNGGNPRGRGGGRGGFRGGGPRGRGRGGWAPTSGHGSQNGGDVTSAGYAHDSAGSTPDTGDDSNLWGGGEVRGGGRGRGGYNRYSHGGDMQSPAPPPSDSDSLNRWEDFKKTGRGRGSGPPGSFWGQNDYRDGRGGPRPNGFVRDGANSGGYGYGRGRGTMWGGEQSTGRDNGGGSRGSSLTGDSGSKVSTSSSDDSNLWSQNENPESNWATSNSGTWESNLWESSSKTKTPTSNMWASTDEESKANPGTSLSQDADSNGGNSDSNSNLWESSRKSADSNLWESSSDNATTNLWAPSNGARAPDIQNTRGGYDVRGRGWRGRGGSGGWVDRGGSGGWADRGGRGRGIGGFVPRGGRGGWADRGGRGRGGYFSGGRGGYSGDRPSGPPPEVNLPPARDMTENLIVSAIVQLTIPEVSEGERIAIEGLECVGSYSWSKRLNPTIIVPGSPREWLQRPLPFTVPFDNGIRMFHEDAYHMGKESALLPLFRTVDMLVSEGTIENAVDWPTVDFVTDRNNLRKLLRWVRESCLSPTATATESEIGTSTPSSPTSPLTTESEAGTPGGPAAASAVEWDPRKDFRIDLQLGGENTILMHRWATRAREWISAPKGGCRSNFESESTAKAPGCEDGEGHYRIVQYTIGGLRMVVRFEVDGFIRDISGQPGTAPAVQGTSAPEYESPVSSATDNTTSISSPEAPRAPLSDVQAGEASLWGSSTSSNGNVTATIETTKAQAAELSEPINLWDAPASYRDQGDKADLSAQHSKDAPSTRGTDDSEPNTTELAVIHAGTLVPQANILELATRSIHYVDRTNDEDIFLQMFLTQTPTHLVAVHQRGSFERVVRQELQSPQFADIAEREDITNSLAKFVALLKGIQRLVKEYRQRRGVSLVCEKGKLEMLERVGDEGLVRDGELARFRAAA